MAVRQNAQSLPAGPLAALRGAFVDVQGLADERGYQHFAGLHGLPLPVQCEHGTDLFLPWHRAYLYLFERALQDRVPEAAVPWWDWTSAGAHEQGLPAPYAAARLADGEPQRPAQQPGQTAGRAAQAPACSTPGRADPWGGAPDTT